jgi:hypothetical protein
MQLKVAGTMLYWAEGYQSNLAKSVDFANSQPKMILVFLKFLREICGIQEGKLRGFLYAYSDQDIGELITFWSGLTKSYNDKKLLFTIKDWIEKYSKCLYT